MNGWQQQIAVITLGVAALDRARAFYQSGFGWLPEFENEEIAFYQMNGFVFGLWSKNSMCNDVAAPVGVSPGAVTLAHNVTSADEVDTLISHLCAQGAKLLRAPGDPPHGGRRGYISDFDGHLWEIAWNPSWPIDAEGHVRFQL